MNLNRRGLLKAFGVVGAGTLVGEHLSYLIRQPTSVIVPGPVFSLDPFTKEIFVNRGTHTVAELYQYLATTMDRLEMMSYPNPMLPVTANEFQMENNWRVSEDSLKYLYGGTVIQGKDVYTSIQTMGRVR